MRKKELEQYAEWMRVERNEMASSLSTAHLALSLASSQLRVVQAEVDHLAYFLAEYEKARDEERRRRSEPS